MKNHMRLRLHGNIVLHATRFMQLVASCKQALTVRGLKNNFEWLYSPDVKISYRTNMAATRAILYLEVASLG
jgi:hypothetical protein